MAADGAVRGLSIHLNGILGTEAEVEPNGRRQQVKAASPGKRRRYITPQRGTVKGLPQLPGFDSNTKSLLASSFYNVACPAQKVSVRMSRHVTLANFAEVLLHKPRHN